MKFKVLIGGGLMFVLAGGLLVACGDKKADDSKSRGGMPLMRVKLKNLSPEGGAPATAQVVGKKDGQPNPPISVGPVPPGAEAENEEPGTKTANAVSVMVNVGVQLAGEAAFPPGSQVESVEIEAGPEGGSAVVKFHMGQPQQTIPLSPQ